MNKEIKVRKKLDPRLQNVFGYKNEQLARLILQEEKQFIEQAEQISKQEEKYDEGTKEKKLDNKRPKEKNFLFSPIFYGIIHPKSQLIANPLFKKEIYLSGFIKFLGSKGDLESLGVVVRAQSGNVFSVYCTLKLVSRLEKLNSVIYIELAKPLFRTLNTSVSISQINSLHSAATPIRGNNVIVGVVDSLIDIYHPNFRNPDGAGTDGLGTSRILRLWDQFLPPTGAEVSPAPFGYGVEYTQANILTELNKPAGNPAYATVRHGGASGSHGTHVAGIAVGNGRAIGNSGEAAGTFIGAAPNANIIFVAGGGNAGTLRYTDSTFTADACAYIFNQATAMGMPCVINISQSDDQGPHDGSLLSQEFLDGLLNLPGRAVTVSAGNSNAHNSHASGIVNQAATDTLQLQYQMADEDGNGSLDNPTRSDVIEIWYDGQDRITPTVTTPSGTAIGPVAFGTSSPATNIVVAGVAVGSVTITHGNDVRNGDNFISIIIQLNPGQIVPLGIWQIALFGNTILNGRYHAWVDRNNRAQSDFLAPHVTANNLTIADFATTKRFIAVGNNLKTVGEPISSSSGCGPTRDGRAKPEIATVGSSVTSARSRNMNAGAPGNFYLGMSGTSMSAPMVAGAIALLFECKGAGLTWFDIKQILEDTADTTGLAIPSTAFGFGRLRMNLACATPATNVDVWLREYVGDLGAEPAAYVSWASPDIQILDASHNPIPNPIYNMIGGVQENNFIRVTVNNKGTQTAHDTEVHLYWADPGTAIHFPNDWNAQGIYVPEPVGSANWVNLNNKIVIPNIPAGGSSSVEFRWLPPVPGANIRGDNHFCLLARVENAADPSMLSTVDGWAIFTADNNVAIRNVNIQNIDVPGDALFTFYAAGTGMKDALLIETTDKNPTYTIQMPAAALPHRNATFLEKIPCVHYRYTKQQACKEDVQFPNIKIEKPELIKQLTDIDGATGLIIEDNVASIFVKGNPNIHIPSLLIEKGEKMPIKISLAKNKQERTEQKLMVTQLADGRKIGGVVLQLEKLNTKKTHKS